MKVILLGVCILLWVSQPTAAAFPPMIITACVKEHKLKTIDLAIFYGTDMTEASEPVKCYLTCLFRSSGFIINGEVNPNIMNMAEGSANSDPQTANFFGMIKACKDIKSTIECEPGYLLLKCFADYGKKVFHVQSSALEL